MAYSEREREFTYTFAKNSATAAIIHVVYIQIPLILICTRDRVLFSFFSLTWACWAYTQIGCATHDVLGRPFIKK